MLRTCSSSFSDMVGLHIVSMITGINLSQEILVNRCVNSFNPSHTKLFRTHTYTLFLSLFWDKFFILLTPTSSRYGSWLSQNFVFKTSGIKRVKVVFGASSQTYSAICYDY